MDSKQQQQKQSKKTPRASTTAATTTTTAAAVPTKAVTFADVATTKKKKDRKNVGGGMNQKVIPTQQQPEMKKGKPTSMHMMQMMMTTGSGSNSGTSKQQDMNSRHLYPNTQQRHQKDTATADGHMMYELLNTFSPTEYNCFEAYQRASLSASVIEPYVAACIEQRYNLSRQQKRKRSSVTYRNYSRDDDDNLAETDAAKLEDYVATPSQASEIGLIVGIAAKIYAQRLIAEAVHLQKKDQQKLKQQQQQEQQHNADALTTQMITPTTNTIDDVIDTSSTSSNRVATASTINLSSGRNHGNASNSNVLLCTFVYQAVQDRQQRGVDPGFFISNTNKYSNNRQYCDYNITNMTSHNLYDVRRLAALAVVADTTTTTASPPDQIDIDTENSATTT